ncbi:hypothetical protein ACFT30_07665 [Microbacterium ureisolvens]|uniref:hypothetical protein n=1 Tax=Microbacterium ureisolvens TaxID=2781186 RepID=UPI00362E70E8
MTQTIESATSPAPTLKMPTALRLVSVAPSLWRVLDPRGIVIGHLQARSQPGGTRYRARRFHAPSHGFRELGDFWSADDALECIRLAR